MAHPSPAANAYLTTTRSIGAPRSVEYQSFQKVTAKLKAASVEDARFEAVAEAVHLNTRLWTILAVDALSEDNALEPQLRAQIIGLAEFSRKHGLKVLSRRESLEDLIEVNTAIMRGLRGVPNGDDAGGAKEG